MLSLNVGVPFIERKLLGRLDRLRCFYGKIGEVHTIKLGYTNWTDFTISTDFIQIVVQACFFTKFVIKAPAFLPEMQVGGGFPAIISE